MGGQDTRRGLQSGQGRRQVQGHGWKGRYERNGNRDVFRRPVLGSHLVIVEVDMPLVKGSPVLYSQY